MALGFNPAGRKVTKSHLSFCADVYLTRTPIEAPRVSQEQQTLCRFPIGAHLLLWLDCDPLL